MSESGAQGRCAGQHHADTGCTAVQIESQMRHASGQAGGVGAEDLVDIGIAVEKRGKSVLNDHADS